MNQVKLEEKKLESKNETIRENGMLFLLAISPIVIGFFYYMMVQVPVIGMVWMYVAPFTVLYYWGWVATVFRSRFKGFLKTMVWMNGLGLITLALYIWQFGLLKEGEQISVLAVLSQLYTVSLGFITTWIGIVLDGSTSIETEIMSIGASIVTELVSILLMIGAAVIGYFVAENQELRDRIVDLENQLSAISRKEQEIERLKAVIKDLEEKLSTLSKGRNWKKAVNQNVLKSMGVSAQTLCYAVKGYSVKEIVQELNDEVTERTVYRALSVKEDTDLQRITTILHQFKEVFDSHDVMKDDVLKWFTELRVKKLRLVTRDELIKYFGEETLNVARRDAYVQGEYYNVKNIEL